MWLCVAMSVRVWRVGRMAPEIIDNWRVSTGRITAQEGNVYRPSADVFSTTVVVWECLTGEQPYVDTAGAAGAWMGCRSRGETPNC